MCECNTILSAYTLYRHLEYYYEMFAEKSYKESIKFPFLNF